MKSLCWSLIFQKRKVVALCVGNMFIPHGESLNDLADKRRGSRPRDGDGRLLRVYNAKGDEQLGNVHVFM